jgi:transposase
MKPKHVVYLTPAEREQLLSVLTGGAAPAARQRHARVLLKADQGPEGPGWRDDAIATALEVSRPTIERLRKRFATAGLSAALERQRPQREYPRKLDGRQEAQLIALTCSAPPAGRARWTVRLLANRMVELEHVDALSYETVRRLLKKTCSSPGNASSG